MYHWVFFLSALLSLSCAAPAPEPKPNPGPAPAPGPKADPGFIAAPVVYSAAAAVPVAHSYSSVSQFTSHPVPIAKAAPVYAAPYIAAAASAPAAVYSYPAYAPAYHPAPAAVGHPHFTIKVPLDIKLMRPPHGHRPQIGSLPANPFHRLDEAQRHRTDATSNNERRENVSTDVDTLHGGEDEDTGSPQTRVDAPSNDQRHEGNLSNEDVTPLNTLDDENRPFNGVDMYGRVDAPSIDQHLAYLSDEDVTPLNTQFGGKIPFNEDPRMGMYDRVEAGDIRYYGDIRQHYLEFPYVGYPPMMMAYW